MKKLFLILSVPLFWQCGDQSAGIENVRDMNEIAYVPATEQKSKDQESVSSSQLLTDKKIIKNGQMGIEVNQLEDARESVNQLVKAFNGYYSNEHFHNDDYAYGYQLNIRVPAENFDEFIQKLESGTGEILYKNINTRDVTEEFIDLETRLNNKKNYLKRYNELLGKANSVKDIVEIEEKIRNIEEEIESTTGRLQYLNNQVTYSTLELNLQKKKERIYSSVKGDFFENLKISLIKGWFGFVDFLLFLTRLWPFFIIAIVSAPFIKKLRRKRIKKE